jgi:hypothetical protein
MVAIAKWIYRKSDGRFMRGGFVDPGVIDTNVYGVADFNDANQPSALDVFDANTGKRPMTPAEVAAFDLEDRTRAAQTESRRLDIVATVAVIVRSRDVAAWNALSNAQKKAAVAASCDVWRDLRAQVQDFA